MNKETREIEINGVVEVPKELSHEEFFRKFIEFIESQGWSFGGGMTDEDDN